MLRRALAVSGREGCEGVGGAGSGPANTHQAIDGPVGRSYKVHGPLEHLCRLEGRQGRHRRDGGRGGGGAAAAPVVVGRRRPPPLVGRRRRGPGRRRRAPRRRGRELREPEQALRPRELAAGDGLAEGREVDALVLLEIVGREALGQGVVHLVGRGVGREALPEEVHDEKAHLLPVQHSERRPEVVAPEDHREPLVAPRRGERRRDRGRVHGGQADHELAHVDLVVPAPRERPEVPGGKGGGV